MAFTQCSNYHEEHEGHEESKGKDEYDDPMSKEPFFSIFFINPTVCIFRLALLHAEKSLWV